MGVDFLVVRPGEKRTFRAKGKGSTVVRFGLMPPAGEDPEQGANFTVNVK